MFQFSHAKIFPVFFFCFYHHHCYIIYITNVLDNNNNIRKTGQSTLESGINTSTFNQTLEVPYCFYSFFFRRIPQILNQVQLCSKNIVCVYPLPYISTLYNICTYSTSFQGLSRNEFQIFQLFQCGIHVLFDKQNRNIIYEK